MARNVFNSLTVVGRWYSLITLTLSGKGSIPLAETRWPRNCMCDFPNSHLVILIAKLCCVSRENTCSRCCKCWRSLFEKMNMSSRYANKKSKPLSTSWIKRWNVWAAFRRPNVMYLNSNRPNGVQMAVFGMSGGCIGTWWNAFCKSSLLKIEQPRTLCVKSCKYGMGYLSGIVISFNLR